MFHKISNVMAIPDYKIMVMFENEVVKEYDLKPLFEQYKQFCKLKENELYYDVHVGKDRCGVIWDDETDLSSEEIWDNGVTYKKFTLKELEKEFGLK